MTFQPLHVPDDLYFVTGTIVGWRKLFVEEPFQRIVLNSLRWLREHERIKLYAFVVMPHHVHFICWPQKEYTISQVLQSFASFTAHEFLKLLRKQKRETLLRYFHHYAAQHRWKEQHQFWQKLQAKNVFSSSYLRQKIEYIHNNPIAKNWRLSDERWQYKLSSACYYDQGIQPIIPIDDVRLIL